MLGGWAYGAVYLNSDERRRALSGGPPSPLERLQALNRNDLLGSYT
jgi:hypothetical protein